MSLLKKLLLLTFIVTSLKYPAQSNYIHSVNYTVTIHGTSNLHEWSEKVEKVAGNGSIFMNNNGSFDLDKISIIVDAHSLRSESLIMDNRTYKALKADANPEIFFTLSSPIKSVEVNSNATTVFAKGNLTIAGVTKSIEMKVKISAPEKGKLVFQGSQIIKVTDYGIEPPSALFGTLKTGDDITINFKISFLINNSFIQKNS